MILLDASIGCQHERLHLCPSCSLSRSEPPAASPLPLVQCMVPTVQCPWRALLQQTAQQHSCGVRVSKRGSKEPLARLGQGVSGQSSTVTGQAAPPCPLGSAQAGALAPHPWLTGVSKVQHCPCWVQASALALRLFARGQAEAESRGLLLVDTKYELGLDAGGHIRLVDEVHTPDSSRCVSR